MELKTKHNRNEMFLQKVSEIDNPLARLVQRKRGNTSHRHKNERAKLVQILPKFKYKKEVRQKRAHKF